MSRVLPPSSLPPSAITSLLLASFSSPGFFAFCGRGGDCTSLFFCRSSLFAGNKLRRIPQNKEKENNNKFGSTGLEALESLGRGEAVVDDAHQALRHALGRAVLHDVTAVDYAACALADRGGSALQDLFV